MTDCLAGKLPDRWWRDKALLEREYEAHGSLLAASVAHGPSTQALATWWRKHGLPKLAQGGPTKTHAAPPQPGDPVDEVEILRARVAELEKAARGQRKAEVAEERMLQRLEQAIAAAEPRYVPAKPNRQAGADAHEMVLLFSDTHASEVVSAEETLGMNTYDWDVMLARMAAIQTKVASYIEHRPYPISKLHVWMLGDMLSGDIHDELAITNDRPTAEAAVDFAHDTAVWLEEFVPLVTPVAAGPVIEVAGVPGNHPRATRKPAAKQAHNNADWLTYKMIELYHRANPAFRFNLRRGSFNIATACDRWRCLLMHGDGIRTTMPGVPWGGVIRRITTLEQQFAKAEQPIDYVALGHFHTANALDGVKARTFLNGSVKGPDEYSLKQFGSGRDACQILLTYHPRRGVTDVSYLDLQAEGA